MIEINCAQAAERAAAILGIEVSREVRRVPADWQHPRQRVLNGCILCAEDEEDAYMPLRPREEYQPRVDEWDDEYTKWKTDWRPDCCTTEECAMTYEQYAGQRPYRDDFMPNWPTEERTHLIMYENTTEGTPISPAFATPEELARWLVENDASWFDSYKGTYEGWLKLCMG